MNALDGMKQMVKIIENLKFCRNNTCLNKEDAELKKAFDSALIAALGVLEAVAKSCNDKLKKEQSK